MSLRWRIDGRLLCAAKTEPELDDTYIDDRLHYHLSLTGVIEPAPDEAASGLWHWTPPRAPYWGRAGKLPEPGAEVPIPFKLMSEPRFAVRAEPCCGHPACPECQGSGFRNHRLFLDGASVHWSALDRAISDRDAEESLRA